MFKTRFSEEDLKWLNPYNEGDTLIFRSSGEIWIPHGLFKRQFITLNAIQSLIMQNISIILPGSSIRTVS